MSFTDQKPRIATAEECNARWNGRKRGEGFRCYLCGHKFVPGDVWRWVYAVPVGRINFITCEKCDGADVLDRWKAAVEESRRRFWWLYEELEAAWEESR